MRTTKYFILIALVFTTVFSYSIFVTAKPAPQFELPGLDGKMYSLSDFLGKPIIISFFTTQCGFCAEELPLLNEIYHTYKENAGLQVVAINLGESREAVQKMLDKIPYDYLTLLDQETQLAGTYQIFGVPTAYFIDPLGNINDFIIGATNRENIMKKVSRIMWYRGLQPIEIENLIKITPQIKLLDFRLANENPYSDKLNVTYHTITDINQVWENFDKNLTYLVISSTNITSREICQQMALNGYQKVYYQLYSENE
ncbi:MAG: TlpA family protein disulfide reductase [Candidatus Atribacteria bacterium]|nr:TlpA family protein disulfide reductase [Candidatus Atribacteria bacterium]